MSDPVGTPPGLDGFLDTPKDKKATVTEAPVANLSDSDNPTQNLRRKTEKEGSEDTRQDDDAVYVKGHPVIRNGK